MVKLMIVKINEYSYVLTDGQKKYELNLEFYDLDFKINVGDYIFLSKKYITEKNIYSFGKITGKYINKNNISDEDIIKIISNKREIYLQRYYG